MTDLSPAAQAVKQQLVVALKAVAALNTARDQRKMKQRVLAATNGLLPEPLIEGRWYWVRLRKTHPDPLDDFYKDSCDGWDVAKYDPKAAGGWRNDDTWEDFDKQVYCWRLIPLPEPINAND
jgi:hypothetical protein